MIVECVAFVPIGALSEASPAVASILVVALFANGFGLAVSNVHSVSVRQTVTAPALLGRMNAGYRFLVTGTVPIGAVLGGALGEAVGLRFALVILGLVLPVSLLWIAMSPLPRLRALGSVC